MNAQTSPPTAAPTAAPASVAAAVPTRAHELPVLAEVPDLASVLDLTAEIDRLTARLVDGLLLLEEHDLAERATGVALEQWLAIVGRRTGSDRRMLLTTCEVMRRLPTLRAAFVVNGTMSWAQTRTVVLEVCRLPRHLDRRLDEELGRIILAAAGADPDALGVAVNWLIASLEPSGQQAEQRVAERGQFFAMQPRLDGTGGRVWGEFAAIGFATLDAALNADRAPVGGTAKPGFAASPDDERARELAMRSGAARADRLLQLIDHAGPQTRSRNGRGSGRRPQLLVRVRLDTLLDRDQVPGQLLTTLTGGRMWADAATVRRLVTARGADLRAVVLDDTGRVVGVGRRTRIAPGWLVDATLAVHDRCTGPGCQTAARVCHTDHAVSWYDATAGTGWGRTDIDNLAPLCASDNHRKEAEGWTAHQSADGSRSWHHARTGLTTRTMPATWRAPPAD
jgi:hypothetical protein